MTTRFVDMHAALDAVCSGTVTAAELMEIALRKATSSLCQDAFLSIDVAGARAAASASDSCSLAGSPRTPLAGLAISVKDLFDVAGQPTRAASRVLSDAPPADSDSLAVARLRAAGAAFLGRTNMSEFAYSAVGFNPHFGTPANAGVPHDETKRIPGGSSAGAAVSVAAGAAWAALGSDTGGSIRAPAALQGLVGFKNTARLTPAQGCLPLSPTLDTVCAITRSVRDAVLLHEILAARKVRLPHQRLSRMRLAVPDTLMLDSLDTTVERAFKRTIALLRSHGASVEYVALPALAELSTLNAAGGFAAAESWAWHRALLARSEADYDPIVAARIRRGEGISAADYIDLHGARVHWQASVNAVISSFDAVLSPTLPIVAPPIADITNDATFFALNALLLRNPSVVNMLDGCALSLPCHTKGELPVGLMVWQGAMRDDDVLDVSLAIEHALTQQEQTNHTSGEKQ